MVNVHIKFNIQDKVTRTTTDNASNFVKAFIEFDSEFGVVPELSAGPSDESDGDDNGGSSVADEDVEEVVQVISIADTLDAEGDDNEVRDLPKHMRCATHTFHLVASTDAAKVIKPQLTLRSAYRRSMAKAQGLWNLQDRSTLAADTIWSLEEGWWFPMPCDRTQHTILPKS